MDRAEPLVSIVLPTFNGSRFLAASIESCLRQTYRNIDLIIVLDGSTDETGTVLAKYTDPRVRILRNEVNRGLPEALNAGFAHSRGEYLAWTSDDNRYAPEAIEALVEYLESHPRVDFVYCDFWRVDEADRIIEEVRVGPPEGLRQHNPVGYCFLYRREVYRVLGDYNPRARLAEDFEYWLRVFARFNMRPYSRRLYYYRIHGGALTRRNYGAYEALRVAARARRKWIGISWRHYARQMATADIEEAFARYAAGNLSAARRRIILGIVRDPSWLRNRGVISILIRSLGGTGLMNALRKARSAGQG